MLALEAEETFARQIILKEMKDRQRLKQEKKRR